MTDPIRLARPDVGDAELAAVAEVVGSGQLTMGPKVAEFEAAIQGAVGTAHAAVVSSGTAALHLALLALEIGPGDDVIVPAYTFPSTANLVELCGARAVVSSELSPRMPASHAEAEAVQAGSCQTAVAPLAVAHAGLGEANANGSWCSWYKKSYRATSRHRSSR